MARKKKETEQLTPETIETQNEPSTTQNDPFYEHLKEYIEGKRRLLTLPERQRLQNESGRHNYNIGCGWCLKEMAVIVLKAHGDDKN